MGHRFVGLVFVSIFVSVIITIIVCWSFGHGILGKPDGCDAHVVFLGRGSVISTGFLKLLKWQF